MRLLISALVDLLAFNILIELRKVARLSNGSVGYINICRADGTSRRFIRSNSEPHSFSETGLAKISFQPAAQIHTQIRERCHLLRRPVIIEFLRRCDGCRTSAPKGIEREGNSRSGATIPH